MITSIHALIYSDDPPATRAFLRDVLGWSNVEDPDSEPGWLIFKSGASEVGVHPTAGMWEGKRYDEPRHHSISLMCDDAEATVADLKSRGAEFDGEIADYGFGFGIMLQVPGADSILLYQPKHALAYNMS
ncbi:MAG TPA: VOC family protein [Fimbriimonadales bacterium]|nr:VOC family protein [Fimbriimonadales bacterium]